MPLYELKQYLQALIIYWTRYKGEEPFPLKNDMYEDMLKNYLPKVPEAFGLQKILKGTTPFFEFE